MATDPAHGADYGSPWGLWSVSEADLNLPPTFSTPPLTPGWICPNVAAVLRKLPTATRFPSLWAIVHARSAGSVRDLGLRFPAVRDERHRTSVNETRTRILDTAACARARGAGGFQERT
jgi:hypothetical protein